MRQNNQSFLTYLQAVPNARKFLAGSYERQGKEQASHKAYKNSDRFCYFLEHGKTFLAAGRNSPATLQPVLLFYGLGHLLKACLLVRDPDYPPSTKVLAHGLTTRKKKKQNYSFLQDEVKIQPNGLFAYACSTLFNCSPFQNDKTNMDQLLRLIPEMSPIYHWKGSIPLLEMLAAGDTAVELPLKALDGHSLTERKLKQRFSRYNFSNWALEDGKVKIALQEPLVPYLSHPFYFSSTSHHFYTSLSRDAMDHLPEVMIHYIVLYNLSMICRYEVEWWMDLHQIRDTEDYSFVLAFMEVTAAKMEKMIAAWLQSENNAGS
ncbi:YaaC family protein [Thalassobacillus pellis]|uniref:YaaC family protein n=1 Tax=Thalassobacillus pellis TaxID=748008 RepID=UPI00195F48AA|nr:YaaC family protein [Thalassobacillus pellis]MBM7552213.1 hypothetical protein [Thalassobacillus pellis]